MDETLRAKEEEKWFALENLTSKNGDSRDKNAKKVIPEEIR